MNWSEKSMKIKKSDPILWEEHERIGHLVLNNPPANPMNLLFFKTLKDIVETKINPAHIDGIIMYGAARHLSSGADLKELTEDLLKDNNQNNLYNNTKNFSFFYNLEIPVIALVKGVCIGSALELALACHIRLACSSALLGLPEATFDLMPGCGGTQRILELTGVAGAMECILTGTGLSGEEAYEMGLVDAVVPKKELRRRAVELIRKIHKGYNKKNRIEYLKRVFKS